MGKHNISSNAKKLQIVAPGKDVMQQVNIISIPSESEVIIDFSITGANKIFVYGEEVDDFRTVDYEGLTTLNISATQELSKELKEQQAIIASLEKRLLSLESLQKSMLTKD